MSVYGGYRGEGDGWRLGCGWEVRDEVRSGRDGEWKVAVKVEVVE